MQDYTRLDVWQRAHRLVLEVYRVTETFPPSERFGLTRQMRRATTSIPANVAEGCGRGGAKELARFLTIAMGSAAEVEYYLLLARDLNLLSPASFVPLSTSATEIKRMLMGLREAVRRGLDERREE